MKSWHLHIDGMVQGVGFRPFAFRFANRYQLEGSIQNGLQGVDIEFNSENKTSAMHTVELLLGEMPTLAKVNSWSLDERDYVHFKNFKIKDSLAEGAASMTITPDLAICENCLNELHDQKNRRKNYAFITCPNCGPRYSIIKEMPFDRERTSMNEFTMCESCRNEYNNPEDKRFYSQTQSCDACGVHLSLWHPKSNKEIKRKDVTDMVVNLLKKGEIIAVKGIGGYVIMCDAQRKDVVAKLRKRKQRTKKPFAVMYPSLESVEKDHYMRFNEKQALQNTVGSVVLLTNRKKCKIAVNVINPGLGKSGVLLPYAPLFRVILEKFNAPVIATSANISNSPIVYRNQEAFEKLEGIADYILSHDREITMPQDDSVIVFSTLLGTKHVLRRSRGMAPCYSGNIDFGSGKLAMGADMKAAFALSHQDNVYISQYLGDMSSFDTELHFTQVYEKLARILKFKPKEVLIDRHPGYYTSMLGEKLANDIGVKPVKIQHHEAHFMSVLAENNLLNSTQPILGVIWDGSGLGYDGNIWGGEYFQYNDHHLRHIEQFSLFPHILHGKFSKNPLIPALSLCHYFKVEKSADFWNLPAHELAFYNKLLNSKVNLKTSSIGKVFDGIASLLGFKGENSYEGQAALYVQTLAEDFVVENSGKKSVLTNSVAGFANFLEQFLNVLNTSNTQQLAYEFHLWLVEYVRKTAVLYGQKRIAFSGDVFQNSLLTDLLKIHLENQFELYFHKVLSPNDESIGFGQLVHHQVGKLHEESIKRPAEKDG